MTGLIEKKQERVAQELARLALLDRAGCIVLWREWFGTKSPRYLSAVFMRKVLAYEAQRRMLGALPAADMRTLRSIARGKRSSVQSAPTLSAGTHLVREWNGRTYQVEVTQSGYVLDGTNYRSLTAIARRITGANWSGPRFFGLINRSGKQQVIENVGTGADQAPSTNLIAELPHLPDSTSLELRVTDSDDSILSASASPEFGVSSSREAEASSHV